MRPKIELDGAILRANVRAYSALGASVAAVLKNDGYGWGAALVAREIDDLVDSYIVADAAEFWALRMRTRRPIRLLAAPDPAQLAGICAHGGVPNVSTPEAIAAVAAFAGSANRRATVRIGIVDAAGWSGIAVADVPEFAALCAANDVRVELWTHITAPERAANTLRILDAAVDAFRVARVDVVGTDRASTAWASLARPGDRVRIGAGLFGAHLGGNVATRCAIRVVAPVVQWHSPGQVCYAGYGSVKVPVDRSVAVLRCGYGDGFPKELCGDDDILSVGMQYTTRLADRPTAEHTLIDERSDLDRLAGRAGVGPHQFIVGLAQHK